MGEMSSYLRRQGIARSPKWVEQEESPGPYLFEPSERDDTSEQVLRQLLRGLETRVTSDGAGSETQPGSHSTNALPRVAPDIKRPHLDLPVIGQVRLTVLQATTTWTVPTPGAGGGEGRWNPPGIRDVERDREIGKRGEELVYRYELERLRARGCDSPENLATWTSRSDETADHDIRSIAEDGKPLWIEVKSTSGTDGRFEWAKNEFQKALREGDHYELWRVYEAETDHPTAKCFRNPIKLVGETALRLDIGTLRAVLEPMHV
jgi:hypothetical protein